MPKSVYSWTKAYCINTPIDDDVEVGSEIEVTSNSGSSMQKVLSVTVMHTQNGSEYKRLLVEEVK